MRSRPFSSIAAILLALSLVASGIPAVAGQADETTDVQCSFPFSETDATGGSVTVEERPESIVVLQPSAAQTVWELDASDRAVGAPVVPYTDYLEGIEDKTDVTNLDNFSVNREAVVELEPDLVLAPNVVPDDTVEHLRGANQTVFKFGFGTSLEFVAEKTALTGQLIDACEEAAETNEAYWDRIESVRTDAAERENPRVLYYTDGFVAGGDTFIDEVITTAGGTNVAEDHGVTGYGELNEEALVEWNPEVIVVSDDGPDVPSSPPFESTFAVQNDQIAVVNGNYLSQPAPRVSLAVEEVAAALSEAELEGDVEAESADTAVDDETDATERVDDAQSEPSPEDQHGFTIALVLVALLSVALLARRS